MSLVLCQHMPSYHIKKTDAKKFLQSQFIMNLSTMSEDKPHASVMLYAMEDDFSFHIVTHTNTYKAKNLLAHPYASFSVWEHGNMMIQADATVSAVTNPTTVGQIVEKLADAATNDEHFWPPLFRIGGDDYIVFKITPYWMRALDLQNNSIEAKETPFSQIIG